MNNVKISIEVNKNDDLALSGLAEVAQIPKKRIVRHLISLGIGVFYKMTDMENLEKDDLITMRERIKKFDRAMSSDQNNLIIEGENG